MMAMIKNWSSFQHYKNRRPPWIKLHRELIDDVEFHKLSGGDFKYLTMLWIIASEDKKMLGYLPAIEALAFRLRLSEKKTEDLLIRLNHWIILDDSDMLAGCKQSADPETEKRQRREEERQRQIESDFKVLWDMWIKKEHEKDSMVSFVKALKKTTSDVIIKAAAEHVKNPDWIKDRGKYCPRLCKWLDKERWTEKMFNSGTPQPQPALPAIKYDLDFED